MRTAAFLASSKGRVRTPSFSLDASLSYDRTRYRLIERRSSTLYDGRARPDRLDFLGCGGTV